MVYKAFPPHACSFLSRVLSFNKYLLVTYCVPGPSTDTGDNSREQNESPALSLHSGYKRCKERDGGQIVNKQINICLVVISIVKKNKAG